MPLFPPTLLHFSWVLKHLLHIYYSRFMFFTKNKGVRRHYVVKKVKLKAPNSPTENGWKGEKCTNKIALQWLKTKIYSVLPNVSNWHGSPWLKKIMKLRLSKCSKLTSKLDYLFIMLEEIFEISSFQLV